MCGLGEGGKPQCMCGYHKITRDSVSSFHRVWSGDGTQVIRLSSKCLYPRRHFHGLPLPFKTNIVFFPVHVHFTKLEYSEICVMNIKVEYLWSKDAEARHPRNHAWLAAAGCGGQSPLLSPSGSGSDLFAVLRGRESLSEPLLLSLLICVYKPRVSNQVRANLPQLTDFNVKC